jgi:glyceraldehyde 3-phosphate dehydrogenase
MVAGVGFRAPPPPVALVVSAARTARPATVDDVNGAMRRASGGAMQGILAVTDEPLVSMDLKGNEHSSIVDSLVTNVVAGNMVKVAAWYDNEWGYACRVADLAQYVSSKVPAAAAVG